MSLSAGTRLGPYEVLAALGAGGMGEVYRARDARLDRDVAIKVLPENLAGDPVALSRFEREAKAVAAISHPNILAIHDFGTDSGVTFAVTELLDGETLRGRLAGGALPWREAVELAAAVADGLAAAHSRGIVHRDLKPENIFLTSDGRIKILDFGLARREKALSPPQQTAARTVTQPTMPGTVMGTVGYMSPEQVTGHAADARSDIFSFGCVLYEMATGARTFSGRTGAETMSSILRDEPPDPRKLTRELPADVARVILHCLKKEPDQRFQSARDLSFNLKAILAGAPITTLSVPHPAARSRALWRIAAAAAVVAVLLAAGIGIGRLRRDSSSAAGAIESLAVLRFENASRDPEAEYLSDGLAENLIDQMTRVRSLKVMARGTVFRVQESTSPLETGRKLGVGAVLAGSVSRRGNDVSVSAELIDTETGARLWGEKYDRPLSDLLRVQDSIALAVADGLRLRLPEEERRALSLHGTENSAAYELMLKARHFFQKTTEEANLEAKRLYEEAAEADPKFVEARLGISGAYSSMAINGWARPSEVWPREAAEVAKILALEPGNVLARTAIAHHRFYFDWDWRFCESEYRELGIDARVLRSEGFRPIGLYYWARGRNEDAVALTERALRIDPGSLDTRLMRASFLAHAGRIDEAITEYRFIAKTDPSNPDPHYGLADVLRRRGDVPGAIAALRTAYGLSDEGDGAKALAETKTAKALEEVELAVARSRLDDLEALARERYVSPLDIARLQAQAGERENVFTNLEAAFAERSAGLVFLKSDRAWDRVRDDPRFAAYVRRVGIP
ncbi:MAG TPA: protein kinase [Thermoanaerobaculia bacterium]|nr:protein kinase [Thermoanaerobaculia bacterium]